MVDIKKVASQTPAEVLQNNSLGRGMLSRKQIFMHEFIYNMKGLDESIFTSHVDGLVFIIDAVKGKVYKIAPGIHWLDIKMEGSNIYIRYSKTLDWYCVYSTSQGFDFNIFSSVVGKGETSSGKYKAIEFPTDDSGSITGKLKIKLHIMIAATTYGYNILNAMEIHYSHVVHHKNGNKQDNRISNLQFLTIDEHKKIEAEIRSNRKKCDKNLELAPSIIF